jgi:opacity protein-like surface antigen
MRSTTEGLSASLSGNFMGWSSKYFSALDQLEPNGLGWGFQLGYGINQNLEIIGRYDRSSLTQKFDWDYFNYSNTALVFRCNFGSTIKRFRPFLEVGGTHANLSVSPLELDNEIVDFELKGFGLSYAGGLNFFLTRNLSIELSALGTYGKFNTFLINGEQSDEKGIDSSNYRFKVGVRFSFKDL